MHYTHGYYTSTNSGGGLYGIQYDMLSVGEVFKFNPLKGSSLAKFGLSGLQNLASKLNYYNGNINRWQIRDYFLSGVSSIAAPLLANGITDIGLSYLNYQIYYGKQPKDFQSIYDNKWAKSAYKIGLYTLSSFFGFNKQGNTWNMLMNPARYFGATPFP